MKLSCGCELRQYPDETVITVCGLGHRICVVRQLGELVELLEDVDIETGEVRK